MDRLVGFALNILFEELKDKRRANRIKKALYKLHGLIEQAFPELQPQSGNVETKEQ